MPSSIAVKEAVKETLVGSEETVQWSSHIKTRFNSKAVRDPETGQLFMGPEEFIDAIAPSNEDYVSHPPDQQSRFVTLHVLYVS